MAHLALSFFGPFKATLDGQPVVALTSARLRALLAYLAVESEREHSREALAGLFWPERTDQEALSALRYALSNLRQAIGDPDAQPPFLLVTRQTVQFNRTCDHRLDVDDFTDLLSASGPPALVLKLEEFKALCLQSAVDLYQGEFLAGLALGDSPAFEEWVLLKREQLHRQALAALERLAALHELQGDYAAAAADSRRFLALEPWDEGVHRRLMRVLALAGQRSAALAQYDTCRQVLARELGVGLEDETVRLYESIHDGTLAQQMQTGKRNEPGAGPGLSAARPAYVLPAAAFFVGRERELAQLDQFLEQALAGQGRVVFVSGEAGSGKTVLLAEFARRAMAAHSNLLVAGGHAATQAGVGDPYLPFRDILRTLAGEGIEVGRAADTQRLVAAQPHVVEALVDAGPALLDTFLSGERLALRAEALAPNGAAWRSRLEALRAWRRQQGETATASRQEDLFEQVSQVLQTVARRYPLLLVVDDLQWADPGSLALLFHLGRRLAQAGSRILVAGTYRPADMAPAGEGDRHPLQPVVHEFRRAWGEIVVDLDQAAGRAFVDAYLDGEPNCLDEPFRAALCGITGGHALFTVELVRSLRERGHLTRDTDGRWTAGSALDWQAMPARVEAVIAERLDRLPAEWRALLDVASVVGEAFEAELVGRVLQNAPAWAAGADEQAVLQALSGPLSKEQRLVQPAGLRLAGDGQRLSCYRFRHTLFQRYLYHELDEAQRASLHEAVASQLEALHTGQADDLAPRLAWHFEAAGALERAADHCLAAGHRAYRLSAYEEAIAHYRRGLFLLERLPEPAGPAQRVARVRRALALYLGLDRPLYVARGWASPERAHASEQAYELARELTRQGAMSPELLSTIYSQVEVATGRGDYRQALLLAEHFFDVAQQGGDPTALGLAHWALGLGHTFQGANQLGREHLEAAVAFYRDQPSRFPLLTGTDMGVACLSWLSLLLCSQGYPAQGLIRAQEALALARELNLPLSLGMALAVAGCGMHLYLRQEQRVQDYAGELLALASDKGMALLREWVEIALGWCQVQAGEIETGIARMRGGTAAWGQMGAVAVQFWHLGLLAEAYGKAGRVDQGLAAIDEALALMKRVGRCHNEPEIHRLRGELLRPTDLAEAEQCFWRALDVARRQGARWWELRAVVSLARLQQARGSTHPLPAREMLAELCAWFQEGADLPDLREARALLQHLTPADKS